MPEYGSWKDVALLLDCAPLQEAALEAFKTQLAADAEAGRPSLAGKWAPRESSKANKTAAKRLIRHCFPEDRKGAETYRKMLSGLTSKLKTVESFMCGNRWDEIDPSHVPSRCLTRCRNAFLNVDSKKQQRSAMQERIDCAAKFQTAARSGKVHGRASQPHELVAEYVAAALSGTGVTADPIIEAQWSDMRSKLVSECGEDRLGQLVPIADLSRSMPLESLCAAVSVAILCSESCAPAFRDRVLTFSDTPSWVQLGDCDSLAAKVTAVVGTSGSTVKDFEAVVNFILAACVSAALPADQVRALRLLILTDTQFETAWCPKGFTASSALSSGAWLTQHEVLSTAFTRAGYELPEVVYWNVTSKTLASGEQYQLPATRGRGQHNCNTKCLYKPSAQSKPKSTLFVHVSLAEAIARD